MAINLQDIKWYYPEVSADGLTNGGRITTTRVGGQVLPDLSVGEMRSGLTRLRKLFLNFENGDNLSFRGVGVYLRNMPGIADYVELVGGTQEDTEETLSPTEQRHSVAELVQSVSFGDTEIIATLPHADAIGFTNGDRVILHTNTIDEIHENVTVAIDGAEVTITLGTYDKVKRDFPAGSLVSSILDLDDLQVDYTVDFTSATCTFNEEGLEGDNIGALTTDWVLTGTGGNVFDCASGDTTEVFNGGGLRDFVPKNPDKFNRPFIIIRNSAWVGEISLSDSFTIGVTAPHRGVWLRQVVLPTFEPVAGNTMYLGVVGG